MKVKTMVNRHKKLPREYHPIIDYIYILLINNSIILNLNDSGYETYKQLP